MAEQFFSTALKEVIQEIRMQNLTKHVRPFHGEGSAKFRNWLTDMDQLGITVDSERMCVLASLTLGGLAGTFVSRFLKDNPNTQWQTLRQKLRERFSDESDIAYAQEKCRRMRQTRGESVSNFAERLRSAAADAFDNISSPDTQRMLVEIFQKGVENDHLSRYLIRKKFTTLDLAVQCAVDETRADRTFQLLRDKPAPTEPMDIDAVRHDDHRLDRLQANMDRLTKQMDKLTRHPPRPSGPPRSQNVPFRPNRHNSAPPRFRSVPPHPHTVPSCPPTAPRPRQNAQPVQPSSFPAQPPTLTHQFTSPGAGRAPTGPRDPPAAAEPPSAACPGATRVPRTSPYRWTSDGRPICAFCGRVGHLQRQCFHSEN